METRRLILFFVTCIALFLGWTTFSQYMGWTPSSSQKMSQTQQVSMPAIPAIPDVQPIAPIAPPVAIQAATANSKTITVETPLYIASFDSAGGILKSFKLKKYLQTNPETMVASTEPVELVSSDIQRYGSMGILLNGSPTWLTAIWGYNGKEELNINEGTQSISFTSNAFGVALKRNFTFDPQTYIIHENIELLAIDVQKNVTLGFSLGTKEIAGLEEYQRSTRVAFTQGGSLDTYSSISDLEKGLSLGRNIGWAGVMGNYFIAAMIPSDNSLDLDTKLENGVYRVALKKNDPLFLSTLEPTKMQMDYYFGPKTVKDLEAAPNELTQSIDYGWFGWMSSPLLYMLKIFHSFVGNWGIAIILLTVLVKIVLWPLSHKSFKSMQGMKKIQPHMQKIRVQYKDDKQEMNKHLMNLYKTYKINPMGGCLPMVVQLPVFFGLFRALLSAIELRHATFIEYLPFTDFIWLADLSLKDPLYITPIVMGASMFIQQRMTPPMGDPMQAKIMMFLPLIFMVLFINFPSGLVVYWLVNNLLTITQQYFQLKGRSADLVPVAASPTPESKQTSPRKGKKSKK